MASKQTEHYGLNQWAGTDQFVRAEFNEDNSKVDAALAGKAEQDTVDAALAEKAGQAAVEALSGSLNELSAVVSALSGEVKARGRTFASTYVGDGTNSQWIDVGFPVAAVLVERPEGYRTSSNYISSGMAVPGGDLGKENYPIVSVLGNGFYVYHWDSSVGTANAKGYTYYFAAFG